MLLKWEYQSERKMRIINKGNKLCYKIGLWAVACGQSQSLLALAVSWVPTLLCW